MMVSIAEQMVDHDDALGVVADGIFPGHAVAAMNLNRFFGHLSPDPPCQVFQR